MVNEDKIFIFMNMQYVLMLRHSGIYNKSGVNWAKKSEARAIDLTYCFQEKHSDRHKTSKCICPLGLHGRWELTHKQLISD